MEIYDFHAHIYPEKVREKAVHSIEESYMIERNCDGSIEGLIKRGSEAGIKHFVALSVAQSGKHVESINDFALEMQEKYAEITAFGSIHPDYCDCEKELVRIKKAGIKGIKLHPDTQRFYADDEKMYPVYDLIRQLELPIVMHCGDYRYDFDNPERVARVVREFPGLKFVAAHFGGWLLFDRALDEFLQLDCYLDCSASVSFLGKRRMKELIRAYGAERIVFGSDSPMFDPVKELEGLMQLGLRDDELELILHGNAEKILGMGKK